MEDYYQDKKKKRKDFLLGFLVSFGLAIIGFLLAWLIKDLGMNDEWSSPEGPFSSLLMKIVGLVILVLLVGIPEYILIKKYLKERRYIAIGMISGIIIPLLVVGACTPLAFFAI